MKNLTISLLLMAATMTAMAGDRLYIEKFDITAGQTVDVPVLLANGTVYSALQTDVYLTDGLELVQDDEGYVCWLSNRATNNHMLSVYEQEDGALRIIITTQDARTLKGNSGAVFTMSIKANAKYQGNQSITLRHNVAVEVDATKHVLDDFVLNLTSDGNTYDVNGDGAVDVGDVNEILEDILNGGHDLDLDVNGDLKVDVGDVNAILAEILAQ